MTNFVVRVLPVRYVVVAMASFGFIINYMLRNNLNLAIVAMVNHTAVNSSDSSGQQDGPFVWDENVVGLILGSFYYGYICTQIVGGRAAELSRVKYIYGVSLLVAGLLTFLTPSVSYWDYRALVAPPRRHGPSLGRGHPLWLCPATRLGTTQRAQHHTSCPQRLQPRHSRHDAAGVRHHQRHQLGGGVLHPGLVRARLVRLLGAARVRHPGAASLHHSRGARLHRHGHWQRTGQRSSATHALEGGAEFSTRMGVDCSEFLQQLGVLHFPRPATVL